MSYFSTLFYLSFASNFYRSRSEGKRFTQNVVRVHFIDHLYCFVLNEPSPPRQPPEKENSLSVGDKVKAHRPPCRHDLSLAYGQQKQPNQQSHFTKPAKCLLTRMQAIPFLWTSDGQDGSPGLTEDGTGVRREGDVALKGMSVSSVSKGKGQGSGETCPSPY